MEVYPIEFPADDFPICIFDHSSFIFCEDGVGQLRQRVIYDISSQQRMKNKFDFSRHFLISPQPSAAPPSHPDPTLPHLPVSEGGGVHFKVL